RVAELAAEARIGRQVANAAQDFGAAVGRSIPEQVAAPAQAAAMGEEVADRDLAGDVGVVELEAGQVLRSVIVPVHAARVDHHRNGGGGEGLGIGADGEDGVGVDAVGPADVADAVASGEHHRVIVDDGDGEAGHVPVVHGVFDVLIEAGRGGGARRRALRG